jgi:hypothetical protein
LVSADSTGRQKNGVNRRKFVVVVDRLRAAIVADVQAILWKESRLLPDFPREYGDYWKPAKEWDADTLEEIADVLSRVEAARLQAGGRGRKRRASRDRRQRAVVGARVLAWSACTATSSRQCVRT